MIGLKHLYHQLHLRFGHDDKHIAVEADDTALVFGLWKHFSYSFQHA